MTTFQEAFDDAEGEVGGWDISSTEEALEGSPVADGQADDEGTVGEEVAEPKTYFDLEAYGEQVVTIKVDGEDIEVPLSELRNGYMRQEAFTQKTQALAADRQRLQAAETLATAYERNPYDTVRFLAQQHGLTLAEATAQAEAAVAEQEDGWANEQVVDPRVAQLEARFAEMDQQAERQRLEQDIADLRERYGEKFDIDEVVARAIEYRTTDIHGVYKQIAFDRIEAERAAQAAFDEKRTAQDTAIVTAKQALAGTVATGESFAGAGATHSAPITTVADALEAALAGSDFTF